MIGNILPYASIIIVNHNGKHFLEECAASLADMDYPRDRFEVILVDNASTDDSVEYIRRYFPWIRLLQLDKNYGFCMPNNQGVKIAKGEYVVFLNNDTVVEREWLSELVKGALREQNIVSCASKMLYDDRREVINTAGGKITIIGGGFYKGYGDRDGAKYSEFEYTGFGCGAGMLVRKDFFESIGGFDEDYYASCEEHDLGWKSWLYGYKVLYVPTAVMYHRESGTFGSKSSYYPTKIYFLTRNRLYNLTKNLEWKNLLRGLFLSAVFNLYRAIKCALGGNFPSVWAIARGYLDYVKNLNRTLMKRKYVQKARKLSDRELYELGVIATLRESIAEERRLSKVWRQTTYRL